MFAHTHTFNWFSFPIIIYKSLYSSLFFSNSKLIINFPNETLIAFFQILSKINRFQLTNYFIFKEIKKRKSTEKRNYRNLSHSSIYIYIHFIETWLFSFFIFIGRFSISFLLLYFILIAVPTFSFDRFIHFLCAKFVAKKSSSYHAFYLNKSCFFHSESLFKAPEIKREKEKLLQDTPGI